MSSDRFRVQTSIESLLGCNDLNDWAIYKGAFENFVITTSNQSLLSNDLESDSIDLFFNGAYSLGEMIKAIFDGRHSWATVKGYYATFYLLKSSFGANKIAIVKNKGIYSLKISVGEKPEKRDKGKYMGSEIRGDHKTTIATYVKLYSSLDPLQTNTVQGEIVYDKLMSIREEVNYRARCFTEPNQGYYFPSLFSKDSFLTQIEHYINDSQFIYCFQEDHYALAAPIKLFSKVKQELSISCGRIYENEIKKNELRKLLNFDRSNTLSSFFGL